jgi:hypothetical protein
MRMVGKEQVDFFRDVYKEEEARFQSLTDRGKIYLSIVSIFFGGVFLKLDWILEHKIGLSEGLVFYVTGILAFLSSLILVCWALQVVEYAEIADLNEIINTENLESQPLDQFFKRRIADYAVAYDVNYTQNDRRANFLQWSLYLIVAGMVSMSLGVMQALAASLSGI